MLWQEYDAKFPAHKERVLTYPWSTQVTQAKAEGSSRIKADDKWRQAEAETLRKEREVFKAAHFEQIGPRMAGTITEEAAVAGGVWFPWPVGPWRSRFWKRSWMARPISFTRNAQCPQRWALRFRWFERCLMIFECIIWYYIDVYMYTCIYIYTCIHVYMYRCIHV